MLDLKRIREQPERVRQALKDRGLSLTLDGLLEKEAECRRITQELEKIRHDKRVASDQIGELKRQGKPVDSQLGRLREVSGTEDSLCAQTAQLEASIKEQLLLIPNVPHSSVPVGPGPQANKVIRSWGEPRRFSFEPRTHLELVDSLKLIDFGRAAKISGSHFVLFTGMGARLERALINFMLDLHTKEHGYVEIFPPHLVNRASMTGTGQLPKFEEDMYRLKEDDLFLIPTAEVPVTNIHAGEVLEAATLPRRYTAFTACFRREAGSYGKETKGLTRVHEFHKVELVKLAAAESSYDELEGLTADAEKVLQLLELPYRVVALSTGDMGFSSAKTYDLEAYSDGTRDWLEVSSCSNFEDFQARRANIRYRDPATQKLRHVHTLNGSGVALARTLIALLEHHQESDGSVAIPKALRPFLDGLEKLVPP
ncbi:MAG: serine--tRNA ligase [Candidatus Omnitrophica bacterium]|nr:serine--tRNA ligase [Candidatus Omnitrophota bacterium]